MLMPTRVLGAKALSYFTCLDHFHAYQTMRACIANKQVRNAMIHSIEIFSFKAMLVACWLVLHDLWAAQVFYRCGSFWLFVLC